MILQLKFQNWKPLSLTSDDTALFLTDLSYTKLLSRFREYFKEYFELVENEIYDYQLKEGWCKVSAKHRN